MDNNDNIIMSRIAFERMQSKDERNDRMEESKFTRYNKKCKFFCFRFRNGKDAKYIEFLENCPNRMDFIRKAIDSELSK